MLYCHSVRQGERWRYLQGNDLYLERLFLMHDCSMLCERWFLCYHDVLIYKTTFVFCPIMLCGSPQDNFSRVFFQSIFSLVMLSLCLAGGEMKINQENILHLERLFSFVLCWPLEQSFFPFYHVVWIYQTKLMLVISCCVDLEETIHLAYCKKIYAIIFDNSMLSI